MRRFLFSFAAGICLSLLFVPGVVAGAGTQPNLILINIDDLGYGDIGPFGSTNATPNLDRMAKEGRKLTSHYAAPVCSPSRAALMTGCYPKRVLPISNVLFPAAQVGLNPEEITVAELLKQAGYATACIGKWHLGDQPEFLPTRQGFDTFFGLPYSNDMGPAEDGIKSNAGEPLPKPNPSAKIPQNDETGVRGPSQPPLPLLRDEKVIARVKVGEHFNCTRQYTEETRSFIRKHQEKPFFVYLAHSAVHFPFYPSKDFMGKSKHGLLGDWVREVDWSVGQILDLLRELKLDQNTLVIFTSDNGGPTKRGSSNEPLRGAKGETWEGGVRVCTLAWWPGKVPAGTSTDAITSMMDVLPTFAKLAGAALPKDRVIDGEDVWTVLTGEETAKPPRDHFFYYRGLRMQAVRSGPWKLHLDKKQLYRLANDIGEERNVYAQHPDVVKRLQQLALSMEDDLGLDGIGPGCRMLGRVNAEEVQPLISLDGHIRQGFEPEGEAKSE